MKNLYILYDERHQKVVYATYDRSKMNTKIGELVIDGEYYSPDMPVIVVDLDEVEK